MPNSNETHQAPPLTLLGWEPVRALLDFAHAKVACNDHLPRGNSQPVMVIPGLATNHLATAVLRERLQALNFTVQDWGQGMNTGPATEDLAQWLAPVRCRLQALVDATGEKAHLVGWSLGGIVARELSKMAPELVKKVVTLGTPFSGMENSTNAAWAYELLNGGRKAQMTPALAQQLRGEPPVPTVSVFSRTDGVVSWSACLQADPKRTKHIELDDVSHFGLVLSPKVLEVLVQELSSKARYVRNVRSRRSPMPA